MPHYNDVLKENQEEYTAMDTGTVFADKCETPGTYIAEITRVEIKDIRGNWKILWDAKIVEGPHSGEAIPTMFTGIAGQDLKWTKTFLSRIDAMPEKATDIPEILEGLKGLVVEIDVLKNSSGYLNAYIKKLIELRASDASKIAKEEVKEEAKTIIDQAEEEESAEPF